MKRRLLNALPLTLAVYLVASLSLALFAGAPDDQPTADQPTATGDDDARSAAADARPGTVGEARLRARILHETIHGALQVMHRDFFDDENPFAIPSRSLEDVFHELARGYKIELRWLTVNTDVLTADHRPQDGFEKNAVKALRAGKGEFDATDGGVYRYAGAIRLGSQCLKCHVKRRTETDARVAGLLIKMPLED